MKSNVKKAWKKNSQFLDKKAGWKKGFKESEKNDNE